MDKITTYSVHFLEELSSIVLSIDEQELGLLSGLDHLRGILM